MCASARGKLSEILISGADCKSDRTSRVDERGRDGRGLGRDAGLRTDAVLRTGRGLYGGRGLEGKGNKK